MSTSDQHGIQLSVTSMTEQKQMSSVKRAENT